MFWPLGVAGCRSRWILSGWGFSHMCLCVGSEVTEYNGVVGLWCCIPTSVLTACFRYGLGLREFCGATWCVREERYVTESLSRKITSSRGTSHNEGSWEDSTWRVLHLMNQIRHVALADLTWLCIKDRKHEQAGCKIRPVTSMYNVWG
jgi:hypothetical protein